MARTGLHEDFKRQQKVQRGSERAFGFVFVAVFAIIAAWPLLGGEAPRWWSVAVAAVILAISLIRPQLLKPLNWLWTEFGLLLHKVVNPLVMGLIFFVTVTPIGLVMRLLGKAPLSLGFDPKAASYWIERQPPGPPPESMRHQF